MFNDNLLNLLINPYNGCALRRDSAFCLVDTLGNKIPIENGIPNFLVLENTTGLNKMFRDFYDRTCKISNIAMCLYGLFHNVKKLRMEWMSAVEVRKGWKVLETSIGTGCNTGVLPTGPSYFGLDISKGMLIQCSKRKKKYNKDIELFQGNAEYLPFRDGTFDSVFHVGGINFFNDRKKAINEMVRVAKVGAKIVIVDETEKLIRNLYLKVPFTAGLFRAATLDKSRTEAPLDLLPEFVSDVNVRLIHNETVYQLSFRKN